MNTTYLVTISPPPNRYNKMLKNPLSFLYSEDSLYITNVLKKGVRRGYFIPEFDPKGRLHYHGIMTVNMHEKVTLFKSLKPKLERLGFCQFVYAKDLMDKLRWIQYMRKEWLITSLILGIDTPMLLAGLRERPKKTSSSKGLKDLDANICDYWAPYLDTKLGEGPLGDTR